MLIEIKLKIKINFGRFELAIISFFDYSINERFKIYCIEHDIWLLCFIYENMSKEK